jgi:hypothetical protein
VVPSTHQKERRGYLKGCVWYGCEEFFGLRNGMRGKLFQTPTTYERCCTPSLLVYYLHPKARNGFFSPATRHRIYFGRINLRDKRWYELKRCTEDIQNMTILYEKIAINSSDEEELAATQEEVEEWKQQAKNVKATKQVVYILTLEERNPSGKWGRGVNTKIIGIFDSKAAAVARSVMVHTAYGSFDEAIKDMLEDDYEDNRKNPPNNGTLMKIGGDESGEGDYARIVIRREKIYGLSSIITRSTPREFQL